MKRIALALMAFALFGCDEQPKAPEIGDIENIVIEGKKYTAKQYVETFCAFPGAEKDQNCFLASKQASKEMTTYQKIEW